MDKEIAINIQNVKKKYRLGQIGGGTLQGDLQSWWARKRGKEDPNSVVGSNQNIYGQTLMALNGIDLTVYKGEALGIIGKNGAGKSTLLKLLSRVTAPTEGSIDIYGRVTSMLEVGTGFHGEMTGRENVYMNGAILGMTKAEIDEKMDQIIEFSEVGEFIDTPVKRYSSGMYVKLAFSVAAHLDSEIMIMDEVLAVGDMAFQQKCLDKMFDSSRLEGKTILYVSHNMNTIRRLCSRCVVLSKGQVIFDGDVEKAISIYMSNNSNETVFMDYSNYKRPKWLKNDAVRISTANYVDKDSCIFYQNEPINIRILWKNNTDIKQLGVRYEIRTKEGTPLATSINSDVCSCKKDTENELVLKYDLSLLAPGRYFSLFTFFQVDSMGEYLDCDCVRGMDIIIENTEQKTEWYSNRWGNIIIPSASVEIIK
ncbi:MAG: ATP-binding cassette domain-containing protein [Solobacterium sp.]|nr:ATP-binding cassette domain-containing protein [Solobacterium sp.]